MFIRRDDFFNMLWLERDKAIKECKSDLAWALSLPETTPWETLIEHAKLLYIIVMDEKRAKGG